MVCRHFRDSNPGIPLWIDLRLGGPSKKRYSIREGFAGSANFAVQPFTPNQRKLFDRREGLLK
jgi:hypothetical protein